VRSPLRKRTRNPSGDDRTVVMIPAAVPVPAERDAVHAARRAARRGADRAARRAAHGLARSGAPQPVTPRSALLTGVIMLALVMIAVTATGIVAATSMAGRRTPLVSPLLVYPVTQTTPGQCLPGVKGISASAASGPVCYQVTVGIAIHRVSDLRVQPGGAGYDVSIDLLPADARAFAGLTREAVGGNLAFVVEGRLVAAPRVDMPITKGQILITGTTTRADAERTLNALRGSRPAHS
jgi:SecDF, P1 head subdomain